MFENEHVQMLTMSCNYFFFFSFS